MPGLTRHLILNFSGLRWALWELLQNRLASLDPSHRFAAGPSLLQCRGWHGFWSNLPPAPKSASLITKSRYFS